MSSFKYKPEKLKFLEKNDTVDERHKKQISDFEKNKSLIPKKKLK